MAFLQIDGITIQVAEHSPKQVYEEIGGRSRAFSGAALSGVRAVRRGWDVVTTPMPETEAEALASILQASGVHFPLTANANSSSGYIAPTPANVNHLPGFSPYDLLSSGWYARVSDVPFGEYLGNKSLRLNYPTTNLLSAETASFNTTIGSAYSTWGAVLSRDGNVSLDTGSGALKIAYKSSGNAFIDTVILPSTITTAGSYVGSVYLRAESGTPTITVRISDGTHLSADVVVTLSSTRWTYICPPLVTTTAGLTAGIYIREPSINSGVTIYVDRAMIQAAAGAPTIWTAGGSSIATTGRLQLVDSTHNPFAGWSGDWAVNVWFRPDKMPTSYRQFLLYGGATFSIGISAAGTVNLVIGIMDLPVAGVFAVNQAWHMLTLAHSPVLADGGVITDLYVDGVLIGSTSTSSVISFPLSGLTTLDVGSTGGATVGGYTPDVTTFTGPIGPVTFLRCRPHASTVAKMYSSGAGAMLGLWPKHRVTGDIISGRAAVDAFVQVKGSDPSSFVDNSGVWQSSGRVLNFSITEI